MRAAVLLLCFAVASLVFAEDEFKPLFNGKDLSGWVPVNVASGTDRDTFTVKDGMIVCTGIPTGVMRTERMYENFVVELEWRHLVPKGNAGFFLFSDALTAKGVPFSRGLEVQILDGPTPEDRRYTTHGDLFPIHGATAKPAHPGKWGMRSYPTKDLAKPSPAWNHYRIESRDGVVTLHVNGELVNTIREVSPRKGYLCLESEGGVVHFRNLRIKELPASAGLDPKHVAVADEGFKSLYTGVDLSGWTTTEAGKRAWQAKDWSLHYEPPKDGESATAPGAHALTTERKLGDFELILDYRATGADGPQVLVRNTPVNLPGGAEKPAWRRARLTVKGTAMTVEVDGKALPVKEPLPSGEAPLVLRSAGAVEFANVYAK